MHEPHNPLCYAKQKSDRVNHMLSMCDKDTLYIFN